MPSQKATIPVLFGFGCLADNQWEAGSCRAAIVSWVIDYCVQWSESKGNIRYITTHMFLTRKVAGLRLMVRIPVKIFRGADEQGNNRNEYQTIEPELLHPSRRTRLKDSLACAH
jgi:hypothetical protein